MPVNKNSNSKNLSHKKVQNVSTEKLVGGNDVSLMEAPSKESSPEVLLEAQPEAQPEALTEPHSTEAPTKKPRTKKALKAVETAVETTTLAPEQTAGGNKKKVMSQKATVSKTTKDNTTQKETVSKTTKDNTTQKATVSKTTKDKSTLKDGKSKAVVKQTKISKKVVETDVDDDGIEKTEKGVRSFKVQLPNDEVFAGRFTGLTPYQAANKALSKYFRENKTIKSEITFSIRESTRGSKRSTYVYSGKREKLGTPVKYSINGPDGIAREIVKEYKNKLTKVKKTDSKEVSVSV